jgi:hypothetical protein
MALPVALDTDTVCVSTCLYVCFIDYSLLVVQPLKLCDLFFWQFDKTARFCKCRGNRCASLLGVNLYGCDFTDFWWKFSER